MYIACNVVFIPFFLQVLTRYSGFACFIAAEKGTFAAGRFVSFLHSLP